jgi:hypothetical protein
MLFLSRLMFSRARSTPSTTDMSFKINFISYLMDCVQNLKGYDAQMPMPCAISPRHEHGLYDAVGESVGVLVVRDCRERLVVGGNNTGVRFVRY